MPLKLTKNKHGVYAVSGTVGGRRLRKSLKTSDKKVARFLADKLEKEEWERKINPVQEFTSFESAALAYMRADGEARFLKKLILYFRGIDISTIRSGHIRDAAKELYPGASPGTWNRNAITPCQAVINFAAERGWCPPIRVQRFKVDPPKRKAADKVWLGKFIEHANPEIGALAMFMFTTGSRISEALRVRPSDIVGRTVQMETKTGPREAILTREMMLTLNALAVEDEPIFRYTSKSSIYNHWYKVCDAAGIERLPPHQAGRHAFATEMIVRQGIDPKTTSDLGGWKSPRLLMERYTHPEKLKDVIDDAFPETVSRKNRIRKTSS